jgi:hypothetical protein
VAALHGGLQGAIGQGSGSAQRIRAVSQGGESRQKIEAKNGEAVGATIQSFMNSGDDSHSAFQSTR